LLQQQYLCHQAGFCANEMASVLLFLMVVFTALTKENVQQLLPKQNRNDNCI